MEKNIKLYKFKKAMILYRFDQIEKLLKETGEILKKTLL